MLAAFSLTQGCLDRSRCSDATSWAEPVQLCKAHAGGVPSGFAEAVSQKLQHIIRISPSHLQPTVIVKCGDLQTYLASLQSSIVQSQNVEIKLKPLEFCAFLKIK